MKKRNGFTLIELLAVIVILAVIALIATPIIMGVINDSKKGAAKDSMYSYVKAVELAQAKVLTEESDLLDGTYTTKDGNLMTNTTKVLGVDIKGTKPSDNGTVTITNGTVTNAKLKFDGYEVTYDGREATVGGSSTPTVVPIKTYTEGDVIYYNPETNKKCISTEVNNAVNAKTGCLKWNVITMGDTENKTTIDIMLDHNSTAKVAWNSTGTNTEMKELATALQTDVTTWTATVKSTARLITGQEVANLEKNTVWNSEDDYIGIEYSTQSWLYQNLSVNNTAEKPYAYWTSTANSSGSDYAWYVYFGKDLDYDVVSDELNYGVRPVITISKSVIA